MLKSFEIFPNGPAAIYIALTLIIFLIVIFLMGPRPRLNPNPPRADVPAFDDLAALSNWLAEKESRVPHLEPGAEACIQFYATGSPAKTSLCFVYIHGFSATWPETAPVTENLAQKFGANVLQARLTGHGTHPDDMVTPAEDWLASMVETFEIARQLGDKTVIIATSTGAPLTVWLASLPQVKPYLHALLFMSPNFKVRVPYDFLFTAPWSRSFLPLISARREWEPVNEAQARYWQYSYSTLAIIEMQKVVDWAKAQDLSAFDTPLALMYMRNDPTIEPRAAIAAFGRWGASEKQLIEVDIDGDAEDHVFAGDICAPHRTEWTVDQFQQFLDRLNENRALS